MAAKNYALTTTTANERHTALQLYGTLQREGQLLQHRLDAETRAFFSEYPVAHLVAVLGLVLVLSRIHRALRTL